MKPSPLRSGHPIGIVAPSSAPLAPDLLPRGLATLRARGFEPVTVRDELGGLGYLSGPDDVRLAEMNHFLRRDDVGVLMAVRGGYGAVRLLPHLDYAAARAHPKLLVGYSDVTALHLALYAHAGWTGVSGSMVAVEWPEPDAASEALFWALLRGGTPAPLLGPQGEALQPLRPGTAEGVLLGGNLTLVARLIGTPYLPDLTGCILFLEEVGEAPYRIDGLLAQLQLAGILDALGGLVFGAFTEAEPQPGRPSLALDDVIAHYTRGLACPVARGLVYGHFPAKSAVPVGVHARLTVRDAEARLDVLEPVVGG